MEVVQLTALPLSSRSMNVSSWVFLTSSANPPSAPPVTAALPDAFRKSRRDTSIDDLLPTSVRRRSSLQGDGQPLPQEQAGAVNATLRVGDAQPQRRRHLGH